MRRSVLAIITGILLIVILSFIFTGGDAINITIITIIGGIISGFLARRRGLAHGLITGAVIASLLLSVYLVIIGYATLVLRAKWNSNNTLLPDFLFDNFKLLAAYMLNGGIGGIIGEQFYVLKSKFKG